MPLNFEEKKNIVLNFGKNSNNSGMTEVQIALFSKRIDQLQKHFLRNKKDFHSRRGLFKIISKRRKLLNYLKNNNFSRYSDIIEKLNLRY